MTRLENKMWERRLRQKDLVKATGKLPGGVHIHLKRGIKTMRVAKQYAEVLKCDPRELLD